MKINYKILIVCLILVFGVGSLGGVFTSSDTEWYNSIKPNIAPPDYIFPIVWNILFFLIAISLYTSWMKANKKQRSKIAIIFGGNLFFNFLWSLLFFGFQKPTYAFLDIILIWLTILMMILITWKIEKKSSLLLIPYLIWTSFAGVLNWIIIGNI